MEKKTSIVLRLYIVLTVLCSVQAQAGLVSLLQTLNQVVFERQAMSKLGKNGRVEGYWASSENPAKDQYQGLYPFPQKSNEPWAGKEAFVAKLAEIESNVLNSDYGTKNKYGIEPFRYRGPSFSRIDGSIVGCAEFYDAKEKITWPQGYREHYVEKYNVKPSKEFYDYVMKKTVADQHSV